MAIYVPGLRGKRGRPRSKGGRSAVVALNMTAMVDMFTVLCVFLLQNYATTNQVLPLPEKVDLPAAREVKELKPANVVIISVDGILLNNIKVAEFNQVKEQEDWMVVPLAQELEKAIQLGEQNKKSLGSQIRTAVKEAKQEPKSEEIDDFRKVTVQSDKNVDFLTVKKIMYTVTEAGMREINFAVLKKPEGATQL